MFQEFATQENVNENLQNTLHELLNIIHKDNSVAQFIQLMHDIKKNDTHKQIKSICCLNKKEKNDDDLLVDLEIEGYHVLQVVLDFISQVNIMTWHTWEQLGSP